MSVKHQKYETSTELSKLIGKVKDEDTQNTQYTITVKDSHQVLSLQTRIKSL